MLNVFGTSVDLKKVHCAELKLDETTLEAVITIYHFDRKAKDVVVRKPFGNARVLVRNEAILLNDRLNGH